ncbi:bifunctional folylpolyglutamate synthase/dihydrofolate synthase [Streptococcus sp. DD13]|uniref:bifunctional folylpolyglutamate synthase/dihydrofolate synthase n=1 Tax=Streptococcus sp. DD13 TaxID=1777881 RepID=UPI0007984891|nr:folylpolyglutamate synthase/dihydrofolate synthase family protein [Streptococcus sp. DD13]KXT77242.1 Dihydrofolate synthase / Folylpolyglutamate synthase [Streptococcus sp. DD13]
MNEKLDQWLFSKQGKTYRYKMEKIRFALDLLGNPERSFSAIHVAGTNGKGSTVAFLRQLLQGHGYRVGTFTSPHLEAVYDRIAINGRSIPADEFYDILQEVVQLEEKVAERYEPFNFFESMTLTMFLYFSRAHLDVAVIEVGIGGLLDTTNVIDPVVSCIVSVGLDHQDMLGTTLSEIAAQKAGIIKRKTPVVLGPMGEECLRVCLGLAQEMEALAFCDGSDFQLERGVFTNALFRQEIPFLGLKGAYQEQNAAVALEVFCLWQDDARQVIDWDQVRVSLQETTWPGRLEQVSQMPDIYIDGAHNLPAIERLVEFVKAQNKSQVTILFSALKRKDYTDMVAYLQKNLPACQLVLTNFAHEGVITSEDFDGIPYEPDYRSYLHWWQNQAKADDLLMITGSLYFISDIRPYLFEKVL